MNKICGLYARTSTGRQEKEETIDSQIAEIKERIKQDGNVLAENLVFIDDGWSGSILARPALDLLRDAVKRKEIEVIYIYDNGRLSRDFTNLLVLLREFEEAEIKLISLHDINPTNPEEGVMQKVMGVFHDYERTKIAERFRRGKLFKARNGNIVHGDAPYGYTYIYKTKDRD
ncbi:recombinase family protein, partial [Candidatus Gottesmanbacteria bacterium]|nr:recombinase family protein [Candidatus Gottesmanbacteria bacterium]